MHMNNQSDNQTTSIISQTSIGGKNTKEACTIYVLCMYYLYLLVICTSCSSSCMYLSYIVIEFTTYRY